MPKETVGISSKLTRNSSIELLRILAMLMIVFHHFACHSGIFWSSEAVTISRFWYNALIMIGAIGDNVFVLISGYFLSANDGPLFNLKKAMKFWGPIFFYSVVLFVVFCVFDNAYIDIRDTLKKFFPITFSEYWFASCYFVMYLVHPYLNRLIISIDKATYQGMLDLLVVCWSVIPTLTNSLYQSNRLLWFITLYLIAGYVRRYDFNPKYDSTHYFRLTAFISIITYGLCTVCTVIGAKWEIFSVYEHYLFGLQKLTMLLISVCLFMAFAKWNLKYNKWINIIASATFGVYLIHDNNYMRPFLWLEVFHGAQDQFSLTFIPYSIWASCIVYICCTVIDLVRRMTVERPYLALVDKYADAVQVFFESIFTNIHRIVYGNE